jgi:Ca2+-binding RTX toxin-like protein
LALPPGSDADIVGGLSRKSDLVFQSVGGSLTFDLANELVMRDGLPVARLDGFVGIHLDLAGQGSVHVLGTERGDVVSMYADQVSASLAGGRDNLTIGFLTETSSTNDFDGGQGRDSLGLLSEGSALTADLAAGWLRLDKPGTSRQFALSGVENIGAHVARAHIHGDRHRNYLVMTGCPARVDGAGGRDVLRYNTDGNCRGFFRGGPGRDRLIGGTGNDRLLGGRGNDFANGWTGRDDVCRVEVAKNCDR